MTAATPTPFQSGPRLIDGDDLNNALGYPHLSYANGITALAGGGRTGAPVLTQRSNQIKTVASAADSAQLPVARPGAYRFVANGGANAAQIFANGSDKINAIAGATGISLASGANALFFCPISGQWYMILTA